MASKKKGKKGSEEKTRVILGRPGNNVKIGVVGMPNVGKSTIFNCISKQSVPAENYSFCTIDPNLAKCQVPDKRFDELVKFHQPAKEIPAVLTVCDIAGLVKGAHEGKGLGNAFLSHISAVDAIYHVCRAFKDKDVEHYEGEVDPVRDLETISNELLFKDIENVKNQMSGMERLQKRGALNKEQQREWDSLEKALAHLEDGKDVREGSWTANDIDVLNRCQLLSAKPVIYLVNISRKNWMSQKNKWLVPLKKWISERSPGAPMIPFCAKFEAEVQDMESDDRAKFMAEHKTRSMLDKIITTGYHYLDLIHFFTCGKDEVRAWTIRRGYTAPNAAGVIHTDFERGFISAEIYAYDDFVEFQNEAAIKAAGRLRQEGKNYIMKDGDIVFFKFNVTAPKKK
jgi:obg-like ATPase 1